MTFGDLFPASDRLESIRRQLVPGVILYLHCQFTTPAPKSKYLVLVCSEPLLFLVINSDQRELVRSNARWRDAQVPLLSADYPFLDHDSWVDCTGAIGIEDLPRDSLERQILADMQRIKDPQLSSAKLDEIPDAVAVSPGILPRDRNLIVAALSNSAVQD